MAKAKGADRAAGAPLKGNVVYQFQFGGGRGMAVTLDLDPSMTLPQINAALDTTRTIGDRQRCFYEIEAFETDRAGHAKTLRDLQSDMERLDKQSDESLSEIAEKIDGLRGDQDAIMAEAKTAWAERGTRGEFRLTGSFQSRYNAKQAEIRGVEEQVKQKKIERENGHKNAAQSAGKLKEEIARLDGEIDKRRAKIVGRV